MNRSSFPRLLLNFFPYSIPSWILLLSILRSASSIPIKQSSDSRSCDFEIDSKDHSVSDLLRCTDLLASESPKPTEKQFSEVLRRVIDRQKLFSQSSGRQGFGFNGSPYELRPGGINYRPGRPILDPLGSGYDGFNGYPDPYDPAGSFNSGLAEALNSISRYDELKCVPRLLCEIATGSTPGSGEYKASALEDFGKQTLFGLLSSYDLEAASPILAFGKAALLGYTNRGDSSICYQEYIRCPRDPRELVYYLNNHNGGFFRFFKNTRRGKAVAQGSNRLGLAAKEPAPPPGLSGPESDRTGTGELKFDNPEPSTGRQDEEEERVLNSGRRGFSRIVFPKDDKTEFDKEREELSQMNSRVPKSLNNISSFFPSATTTESSSKESLDSEPGFFPEDDRNEGSFEKTNVVFDNGDQDSRDKDYYSGFRKERVLDSDRVSAFTFPDQREIKQNFDSGVSKILPFSWE